ncbi:MAG TPA: hypothetical protein VFW44_11505 [Bryobacteraceae bacterium]|nr:hypothetical protein [Bryobacteraceae bacterium]
MRTPKMIVPLLSGFSLILLAVWQIVVVWLLVRAATEVLSALGGLF